MSRDKLELPGLKKPRVSAGIFRITRPTPKFDDEPAELEDQGAGEDFKLDNMRLD